MDYSATGDLAAHLRTRLPDLTLRDEHRLGRQLDRAGRLGDGAARAAALATAATDVEAALGRVDRRRAAVPTITYPALPVTQRRDDLLAAVRDHQVVIVAGETGSGKTTQLPKICLELGRGVRGLIGHTQPRRLAARTVADRIAEELGTEIGGLVGWKVRFTDQVGDDTMVKVMTDGILLAEIQHDRSLLRYDTLIIDEAHERSLNIDFILGYLTQLLPRRPDLKVVITSATIDVQRFSRHFGDAPVVEVSGRTYPVEVRYRPLVDPDEPEAEERDQIQGIVDAVAELRGEGPGDVLVFLSGEREIRDTADALNRLDLPDTEVLPLYARLSMAEQHRVFARHAGRRIVLATNVAETSLTVPGIRYVVDPGTARISRYSHRLKVQRLPIEPVSQASANQRAGRCGRVAEGVCIRLYTQDDYDSRPPFTDPEILRTNLASVILQMTAIGLGDIAAFPFVEPPDRRQIADGVALLRELGALAETGTDRQHRLTPLGRQLAQLPIDPRLARMVLAAQDNGCLAEVMVIAAALSIQDPRERPTDKQQAADAAHARFAEPDSDFLGYLNLWRHLRDQQKSLSSSQFRRMCRTEFLNYLRVREWQDLNSQLRAAVRGLGTERGAGGRPRPADPDAGPDPAVHPADPPEPARIHQSLLPGLLSHLGLKDAQKPEYLGARGARFAIFPGSTLAKKPPRWVMAAELVETSRLWGRIAARIEPEWIEPVAGHLVARSYSEPHWNGRRGAAMAYEKVTLYGLPVVARRLVNYGRIDAPLARELFIRHGLVEGDWQTHHPFLAENRRTLHEIEELEQRVRRRDIAVGDDEVYALYDARIPAEVVSARHFDTWWKRARQRTPGLLTFTRAELTEPGARGVAEDAFPAEWEAAGARLPLSYRFDPGAADDGVTVQVPLALLGRLDPDDFGWQVPGLRHELVTALIRSLPKPVRRNYVPAPDFATAVLEQAVPRHGPLPAAVSAQLRDLTGIPVPPGSWDLERVPAHLRMTFRVLDAAGKVVGEGRDLAALADRLRPRVRAQLTEAIGGLDRRGMRRWEAGPLPRTVSRSIGGYPVTGFPTLVDEGETVGVRVVETAARQRQAMLAGTRRLLQLAVPSPVKLVNGQLSNQDKLALSRNPHRSAADLMDDCVAAALDQLIAEHDGPAWDQAGFDALAAAVRTRLAGTVLAIVAQVRPVLTAAHELRQRLAGTSDLALLPALRDVREQLDALVSRGFVQSAGARHLPDLPRYLLAAQRRLDRLPANAARDREAMLRIHEVQQAYRELLDEVGPDRRDVEAVREIRWMVEELRVSLFAQALGTPYPISEKRIYRAMDHAALPE